GLFIRSEDRALRADAGYDPRRVVVTFMNFPYNSTVQSTRARTEAIVQRVRALPGVKAVAFSDSPPLFRPDTVDFRPPARRDASQPVDIYTASPHFFETLGIPILRGREFQETDGSAAIASQTLASAFWRRQNPIGQTLSLPSGQVTVVGV